MGVCLFSLNVLCGSVNELPSRLTLREKVKNLENVMQARGRTTAPWPWKGQLKWFVHLIRTPLCGNIVNWIQLKEDLRASQNILEELHVPVWMSWDLLGWAGGRCCRVHLGYFAWPIAATQSQINGGDWCIALFPYFRASIWGTLPTINVGYNSWVNWNSISLIVLKQINFIH